MNLFSIFINSPLYLSIFLYLIFVIFIITFKPSIFYCEDKKTIKITGCGNEKTIFSLPIVLITFAILIYFIMLLILY